MDMAGNTTTRITKPMKTTTAVSPRGNVKTDTNMRVRKVNALWFIIGINTFQ